MPFCVIYFKTATTIHKFSASMYEIFETFLFQNPGVLRGVMQKVNPFKSTSQVTTALCARYSCNSNHGNGWCVSHSSAQSAGFLTQVSKAASSESLEQGRVSESNQVTEWIKFLVS